MHPAVIRDAEGEPILDEDGFIQYEKVVVEMPDGTEVRRHAGLRTDDGVSKAVAAEHVAASIVMFTFIYLLLGAVWLFVLNRKIQAGPEPPEDGFSKRKNDDGFLKVAGDAPPESRLAEAGLSPKEADQ